MKKQSIKTLLCWLLLAGFLCLTQPVKLPAIALIVPFVILFTALVQTWTLLALLNVRLAKDRRSKVSKRVRGLSVTVSAAVVMLLVLQSLGQLTFKDILTMGAIVGIGYMYYVRNYMYRTDP